MKILKRFILFLLFILVGKEAYCAYIKVPKIFSDNLVLQRDTKNKIWGWCDRINSSLTIKLDNKLIKKAIVNASGVWEFELPATPFDGKQHIITIEDVTEKLLLKNIVFGDVFFCSGQSNMAYRMLTLPNFVKERDSADYPMIRYLEVTTDVSQEKRVDITKGTWVVSTNAAVKYFSALAFFYAKELYRINKVPIGIITSAYGGTPIEAWLAGNQLKDFVKDNAKLNLLENDSNYVSNVLLQQQKVRTKWLQEFWKNSVYLDSSYNLKIDSSFFYANDWRAFIAPDFIKNESGSIKKGYTWYRKIFTANEDFAKSDLNIHLGRLTEQRVCFLNRTNIGMQMNYDAVFKLPKGLLKSGKNEVIICAYNEVQDKTGFNPITALKIEKSETLDTISLNGEWLFKQGTFTDLLGGKLKNPGNTAFGANFPTLLYNAMVYPFKGVNVKGVLWYQGESNADTSTNCFQYDEKLTRLIKSWRDSIFLSEVPFFIVQLANYGVVKSEPIPTGWNIVQEAQYNVSRKVKNVYTIITNDIGNANDIHPSDKKTVAKRMSLYARKYLYGERKIIEHGPEPIKYSFKSNQINVKFKYIQNIAEDSISINGFAIADKSGNFLRAKATLIGNTVIVSNPRVTFPKYVRYAFEPSPVKLNFYNQSGLPARPFRNDTLNIYK